MWRVSMVTGGLNGNDPTWATETKKTKLLTNIPSYKTKFKYFQFIKLINCSHKRENEFLFYSPSFHKLTSHFSYWQFCMKTDQWIPNWFWLSWLDSFISGQMSRWKCKIEDDLKCMWERAVSEKYFWYLTNGKHWNTILTWNEMN